MLDAVEVQGLDGLCPSTFRWNFPVDHCLLGASSKVYSSFEQAVIHRQCRSTRGW